ncbi:hypothetical protein SteCoe_16474 [Stentor coeruleus]|uniref:Uncharacterized protein n=1 Tax=Stentor coeruleus TaxID=5963 RepID=A0A1R2C1A8_9CILI|nr:hypothetical protein SteCoe_16474 [Stentor coeruleus]
MEDLKEIRNKETDSLNSIKQKASELKHTIECIRLDGTQTWREILKHYSLAASTIQYLQSDLSTILDHRVLVPSYELHENQDYVPSMIASRLNDNIDSEAKTAASEFDNTLLIVHDYDDQVTKFNSFCHELRTLLRK